VWLDFGLLLIQLISIYRMFFIINISLSLSGDSSCSCCLPQSLLLQHVFLILLPVVSSACTCKIDKKRCLFCLCKELYFYFVGWVLPSVRHSQMWMVGGAATPIYAG